MGVLFMYSWKIVEIFEKVSENRTKFWIKFKLIMSKITKNADQYL